MTRDSDGWNRSGNQNRDEHRSDGPTREDYRALIARFEEFNKSCLTWSDFDRWDGERKQLIEQRLQTQERVFASKLKEMEDKIAKLEWVNTIPWKAIAVLVPGFCSLLWWIYIHNVH